ncbi:MAG: uroporphyrinogen-III C-methyltransferase [Acidobacteria bacterium]|nr:uroporphyrinogen-III C-methyltransferase [Acidobacteriota bacterium]
MNAKVYLIGAGPGDPDLITVRGRRILQSADVVLYDNLAAPELLLVAARAEKIYVGKKKANHSMPQAGITELMIAKARAHRIVVRLKGGDPFIFGRGGEELEALHAAGIEYEVVPGVTSALGLAACTGVPLTHREHTSSVTFLTGHDPSRIDWSKAGHAETLVIYMGLATAAEIASRLMQAGRAAETPVLVVQRATTPRQHTVRTVLRDLGERARALRPPATIVIGEVAALGDKLDWFARRPLHGQTVLVTRAEGGSGDRLRDLGARVVEIPVIAIEPVNPDLPDLSNYDWTLFTSAHAVTHFFAALRARALDARAVRGRVLAIGPATAAALTAHGILADLVVANSVAEGAVDALAGESMEARRVLFPRAAQAREVLVDALTARGATVDVVEVYRNVVPAASAAAIEALENADWVTFTSSSTVKNFLALGGRRLLDQGAHGISIGPATSDTMRAHGVEIAAEALPHTFDGVIDALCLARRTIG